MFVKDEKFNTFTPEALLCKECKHAFKPVKIGDHNIERYMYSTCGKFNRKPNDVLWDGANCELFEKNDG